MAVNTTPDSANITCRRTDFSQDPCITIPSMPYGKASLLPKLREEACAMEALRSFIPSDLYPNSLRSCSAVIFSFFCSFSFFVILPCSFPSQFPSKEPLVPMSNASQPTAVSGWYSVTCTPPPHPPSNSAYRHALTRLSERQGSATPSQNLRLELHRPPL